MYRMLKLLFEGSRWWARLGTMVLSAILLGVLGASTGIVLLGLGTISPLMGIQNVATVGFGIGFGVGFLATRIAYSIADCLGQRKPSDSPKVSGPSWWTRCKAFFQRPFSKPAPANQQEKSTVQTPQFMRDAAIRTAKAKQEQDPFIVFAQIKQSLLSPISAGDFTQYDFMVLETHFALRLAQGKKYFQTNDTRAFVQGLHEIAQLTDKKERFECLARYCWVLPIQDKSVARPHDTDNQWCIHPTRWVTTKAYPTPPRFEEIRMAGAKQVYAVVKNAQGELDDPEDILAAVSTLPAKATYQQRYAAAKNADLHAYHVDAVSISSVSKPLRSFH